MTIIEPRRARTLALILVALSVASPASADPPPDRAEALFQRARALMEKNDFAAACPMLEEAYSLDHGAGTLLAMALCHEGNGKPATALREYRKSLALAVRANRSDRVMLAESHVQQLEAKVPRITLHLPSPTPAGLAITLDGAPVEQAEMIAGAAVDPGKHAIAASASNVVPWRTDVDVGESSRSLVVDVPVFASTTRAIEPPPAPPPSGSRVFGLVVGGVGLVGIGLGSYFGVASFNAEARSKRECTNNVCSADGVTYNHQAKTDAIVADVSIGAGALVLVLGAYLALRASPRANAHGSAALGVVRALVPLRVWAGEGRAGVGVSTSW